MPKLSYEDKINIYNKKKEGISIKALSKKYDVRDNVIKYLVRVLDKHRYEILKKLRHINRNFLFQIIYKNIISYIKLQFNTCSIQYLIWYRHISLIIKTIF